MENAIEVIPEFPKAGRGYICIDTAGHTFRCHVELQAWNAEPPDERNNWEISADTSVELDSGRVVASCLMGDRLPSDILVGDPGLSYNVRLYCNGRELVHQMHISGEQFDHDRVYEQYLAQLWPSRPLGRQQL